MKILLISCYELGHQPLGIAMPQGFLVRAGYEVEVMDIAQGGFRPASILTADFIGISVPMHTALRIGVRAAQEIRKIDAQKHICFLGLYAVLNAEYLLNNVADSVIGGEFEATLVKLVDALNAGHDISLVAGVSTKRERALPVLEKLSFPLPERKGLSYLPSYVRLAYQGEMRVTGYVEATRGCLHHCTHCPIPPVYNGRFFVIPQDVILNDIRGLIAQGARHITFGDADFLNGPNHSLRITRALHAEFPEVTFDFTVKVEHILKHKEIFAELRSLGCIFIISAFESFSDHVLNYLVKGHTRADIYQAMAVLRSAEIIVRPSLVAFTPWTTLDDYLAMLEFVAAEDLVENVDPVQYTIRLLVPPGSLLLTKSETKGYFTELNKASFTYHWQHSDSRMEELYRAVNNIVQKATSIGEDASTTFCRIYNQAYSLHGSQQDKQHSRSPIKVSPPMVRTPRLTEAWFC